jgi:hypothetical protein
VRLCFADFPSICEASHQSPSLWPLDPAAFTASQVFEWYTLLMAFFFDSDRSLRLSASVKRHMWPPTLETKFCGDQDSTDISLGCTQEVAWLSQTVYPSGYTTEACYYLMSNNTSYLTCDEHYRPSFPPLPTMCMCLRRLPSGFSAKITRMNLSQCKPQSVLRSP